MITVMTIAGYAALAMYAALFVWLIGDLIGAGAAVRAAGRAFLAVFPPPWSRYNPAGLSQLDDYRLYRVGAFSDMPAGPVASAVAAFVPTFVDLAARLTCALFGHKVVDADPGDPEVGPDPDVGCVRCGRSW